MHPDVGSVWRGRTNGIPYAVIGATQPAVPITFEYGDESEPGPYPMPPNVPVEGGGPRPSAGAVSGYAPANQVILTALKTYGMMLADNGAPDRRWDDDELRELKQLRGSDFEVVDVSSLMVDPDSGATLP